MKKNIVKYNKQDNPEFIIELRKKVNAYFEDNHISKKANASMKIKTVFMLSLYFVPLVLMITGVVASPLLNILMWTLMGFGMSGVGLSIMHDANHGAYSKNKRVNYLLGFLINFTGGYHYNWKIQHNVLHHSNTNIEGYDDDINNFLMRFSPNQERKPLHKFQVFYAPFFYGLMTLYWFLGKDIVQIIGYNKRGLLKSQNVSFKAAITEIIINKLWYAGIFIVLPFVFIALPWWQTLLGYLLMQYLCGLILALIFQPAHVVEDTNFFLPSAEGTIENNFAVHQLKTTSNYANKSVFFSWFIGGLNFQIEHHLFPNICHIHYKKISKIVKETTEKYNLNYNEHRTFLQAVISHFATINQLGTGTYDKKRLEV